MSGSSTNRGHWLDQSLRVLFPVGLLCIALHQIITYDVWWQIKTGEWVRQHGFPSTDPFSYGYPNQPWIELRWLHGVLVHFFHEWGGPNALVILRCSLLLLTFAIMGRCRPGAQRWAVGLGLVLALAAMFPRFRIRPELHSYLFLAITMLAVQRFRDGGSRGRLWLLPLLQVIWSNAHTLFILGPILLWSVVIGETFQEWLAHRGLWPKGSPPIPKEQRKFLIGVSVTVSAACFATPYFVDGVLFPLQLFTQINQGNYLNEVIAEFRSPFLLRPTHMIFVTWAAAALLSALSFLLVTRQLVLSRLGLYVAFLLLSAMAQRNIALFGVVAGIVTGLNLDDAARQGLRGKFVPSIARVVSFGFLLTVGPLAATDQLWRRQGLEQVFGFGVKHEIFPMAAMKFVEREGLPRPVLGSLDDGGFLLFEGGAKSVLVDGRLEVYGADHVRDALTATFHPTAFLEKAEQHGIQTAVLRHLKLGRVVVALEDHPDWWPVYYDEQFVVYLKATESTQPMVDRLRIDWQDPVRPAVEIPTHWSPPAYLGDWLPKMRDEKGPHALAFLFVWMNNLPEAVRLLEEVKERTPQYKAGQATLALLYEALDRDREAGEIFQALGPQPFAEPSSLLLRSKICSLANKHSLAFEHQQAAIEAGASETQHRRTLAHLAIAAGKIDAAQQELEALAQEFPDDVDSVNRLGALAMERQDLTAARDYFLRSLERRPNQIEARLNLGSVYAMLRQFGNASLEFQKVLQIAPNHAAAQQNLARLRAMGY